MLVRGDNNIVRVLEEEVDKNYYNPRNKEDVTSLLSDVLASFLHGMCMDYGLELEDVLDNLEHSCRGPLVRRIRQVLDMDTHTKIPEIPNGW